MTPGYQPHLILQGMALIAPMLYAADVPPAPVVWLIRNVCNVVMPKSQMPAFIDPVGEQDRIYVSDKWIQAALLDTWGKPNALAWGQPMRFGSGVALLDLCLRMKETATGASFPWLIIHDPDDCIVEFGPSQRLDDESLSKDKTLVPLPGARHDIIANEPGQVVQQFSTWMTSRLDRTWS